MDLLTMDNTDPRNRKVAVAMGQTWDSYIFCELLHPTMTSTSLYQLRIL